LGDVFIQPPFFFEKYSDFGNFSALPAVCMSENSKQSLKTQHGVQFSRHKEVYLIVSEP